MEWYLQALRRDRRSKYAAYVSLGSFGAIVLCLIIGSTWTFRAAAFVFFPLLLASILAIFVVLGIIVRNDYLERSGRLYPPIRRR